MLELALRIYVTPRSHLAEVARTSGARTLIALASPDAASADDDASTSDQRLDLHFNDITEPREGLLAPSREQVGEALAFAGRWDRRAPLIVCCYAGISRSTAIAYAIACRFRPDQAESDLASTLRRLSPSATPNPLIVTHADALLGRGGRMIAAIEAIGRGAEAFEGAPFEWDLARWSA